ncbi:hypothetical protein H5410_002737, partial [Solanum commersonii]
MYMKRLNLLMQGSILYSKIQTVTHHDQIFLCFQYLLLVQAQAQQEVSKCPHIQHSHSKRGTQCMFSPIGLPLFSNRSSVWLTQDHKGLSKVCNGTECK